MHNFTVGRVKSFVYDLDSERGTVIMRVAIVLRSVEVKPLVPKILVNYPPSRSS